jgi:4-amino-4-deoxy-L-arabinose transferase-like glycosyltransferase
MIRRSWLERLALLLILLLAAYLRLANVRDNPGWYTDEATHVDIAQHLLHGRVQYLALTQSTLLVSRPPLFHLMLAPLFGQFGVDMGVLRAFTGTLGVVTVGLLYVVVRRATGERTLSLLAALMLAIYPNAVLYSRFGFSYNLLAPLMMVAMLGLWEYLTPPLDPLPINGEGGKHIGRKQGWLALAALAIGVGMLGDVAMMTFAAPFVVIVLIRCWRDLLWSLPLMALPFGLYAGVMLARMPQVFWFDAGFVFSRLGTIPLLGQLPNVALNYTVLLSQDFWVLSGVVGLFLLRPARLQRLSLLLFLLPLVILGRTAALYSLSFYYMIPLLPLVALGAAALVRYGTPYVFGVVYESLEAVLGELKRTRYIVSLQRLIVPAGAGLVVLLVVVSPLLTSTALMFDHVVNHWQTAIDPFLITPDDARQAADYVNSRVSAEDVVIASPTLAWMFHANAADFQMAVAATGEGTVHFPPDIPPERLAFDPRYEGARFVVVDNLWRNWGAVHIPGVLRMLRDVETWPLAFEAGSIQVYENPTR